MVAQINHDYKQKIQERKGAALNIMICDDESRQLRSAKKLVEDVCRESNTEVYIETSTNGLECSYKILDDYLTRGISYSLLLIDEYMLHMDGRDAIKIIRRLQENKSINKFYIYSVSGLEEDALRNSGNDGTLPKPLAKRQVTSLLNNLQLIKK